MQVIDDAGAATLGEFLAHLETGSVVLTDGFPSYPPACGENYVYRPRPISGSGHQAHELRPGVHRVASRARRWLEATHHGAVKPALVQPYLDEFSSVSTAGIQGSGACSSAACSSRPCGALPTPTARSSLNRAALAGRCPYLHPTSACTAKASPGQHSIDPGEQPLSKDEPSVYLDFRNYAATSFQARRRMVISCGVGGWGSSDRK